MVETEIVSGQQSSWNLVRKLGEGDAGEVYRVDALSTGQKGILKRPRKSAFAGEVFRQSAQIRTEAKILKALAAAFAAEPDLGLGVPGLLDQSKPEADFNARNFIVIESANGLDLAYLGRVAQLGLSGQDSPVGTFSVEGQTLLQAISKSGKIPNRILITILLRVAELLERIHAVHANDSGSDTSGIVWNDVKPDHLFWDPRRSFLTVIDWGNARFLEADRTTSDRQFSWADDYRQFYEEMGRFLSVVAPELHSRLNWPTQFSTENTTPEAIEALKFRLRSALQDESAAITQIRAAEEALLQSEVVDETILTQIEAVQNQILALGEAPDYVGGLRVAAGLAAQLAEADRLDDLRRLCTWAASLPGSDTEQWRLVGFLARIPGRSEGEQRRHFLDAIQAAICREWENLLWQIVLAIHGYPEPQWWQELTAQLRRLALGPDGEVVRPLVAMRRLNLSLQAAARRLEDRNLPASALAPLEPINALARRLREDAIANWTQIDPGPPDSRLDYTAIEPLLAEAIELLPDEQRTIRAILNHPKVQVRKILDAWEKQDFFTAGRGLRHLLLWDPDRCRILRAEHAILAAPDFLKRVHLGPLPNENFPDWLTSLEFQGREFRNQVGPAAWLDLILESCKQIRKGAWPSDLFRSNPDLLRQMPWLIQFERVENLPALPDSGPTPTSAPQIIPDLGEIHGVAEGWLGPEGSVALIEPLDGWMPEARGSSARVVLGRFVGADGQRREAAVKLMRMDQIHYALPLFEEEARVLAIMKDVPGVSRLVECGFFKLDEGAQFPLNSPAEAPLAVGRVLRIGPDATQEYLERIQERIDTGWTPYLAIEKRKQEDSLLLLCDAGMTRGQYLPMVTLLQMAIQISDILQIAHNRKIVYRDHKILHYYWQAEKHGIYFIDWNVARYHPDGLSEHEIKMDLVQFGARGLHHILTGRTAPGALPLGPTRPEEIEQAADSYQTQWTYDDQRLPPGLRAILERILAGEYCSAATLSADLKSTMMQLPDTRLGL